MIPEVFSSLDDCLILNTRVSAVSIQYPSEPRIMGYNSESSEVTASLAS